MICIDVCHQNNDIKVRAQSTFKTPINGEEEFYWIIARKFGSTATSAPFKSATCTRLTRTKRISYSVWSLMYGWTQMLYLVKVFFFKKKIVEGMERCSLLLLKWPSAFNTRSPFHHHHLWGWWDCCYSRIVGRVVRREGSEAKAEWKVVWLRDRSVSDEPLPSLSLSFGSRLVFLRVRWWHWTKTLQLLSDRRRHTTLSPETRLPVSCRARSVSALYYTSLPNGF